MARWVLHFVNLSWMRLESKQFFFPPSSHLNKLLLKTWDAEKNKTFKLSTGSLSLSVKCIFKIKYLIKGFKGHCVFNFWGLVLKLYPRIYCLTGLIQLRSFNDSHASVEMVWMLHHVIWVGRFLFSAFHKVIAPLCTKLGSDVLEMNPVSTKACHGLAFINDCNK